MRASDLFAAIPGTLPAAQIELRAIYAGMIFIWYAMHLRGSIILSVSRQ